MRNVERDEVIQTDRGGGLNLNPTTLILILILTNGTSGGIGSFFGSASGNDKVLEKLDRIEQRQEDMDDRISRLERGERARKNTKETTP